MIVPDRIGPMNLRLIELLERRVFIHAEDLAPWEKYSDAKRRADQVMANAGMVRSRYAWVSGPTTIDWVMAIKRRLTGPTVRQARAMRAALRFQPTEKSVGCPARPTRRPYVA